MLASPTRIPISPPEQRCHLLSLAGERAELVREVCSIPGAGLSSLKMVGDLGSAIGVAINLESHALDGRGRTRAVERIGRTLLREEQAGTMLAIARSLRRSLNLLHLPIGGVGFDLSGQGVVEFKSYFRMHLSRENLEGTSRKFVPAGRDDIAWALSELAPLLPEDQVAAVSSAVGAMRRVGASLEMLGVDFRAAPDLKLYFTPARPDGRFVVDSTIAAMTAAANAVGIPEIIPHAGDLIQFGGSIGLDCNQIAVEIPATGPGEVKIYQDTWNMSGGVPADVERTRALGAAIEFYRRAGTSIDPKMAADLFERSYDVGVVLDGLAVDYSAAGRHAKTYIRSNLDIGMGVALGVGN